MVGIHIIRSIDGTLIVAVIQPHAEQTQPSRRVYESL